MLVRPDESRAVFDKIKEYAARVGLPIHIFVGPDTDGLCATRILTSLFQRENIAHDVMPVTGAAQLERAATELLAGGDPVALVFLNCCGAVDVEIAYELPPDSLVVIVDSHRPYHLNNVYSGEAVYVLDDGTAGEDTIPSLATYETYLNQGLDPDSPGGEAEYDPQYASPHDDAMPAADSISSPPFSSSSSQPQVGSVRSRDEYEGEYGGSPEYRARKAPRRPMSVIELAEARQRALEAQKVIQTYYDSAYFGSAAACLMHVLATTLQLDDRYSLWLAIVGLTDQFIHERIDMAKYEMDVEQLTHEVERENGDDDDAAAHRTLAPSRSTAGHGPAAKHYRITPIDEYRFMLFRHWTLYDSLFHSPYVAARFGIWREPGREKLRTMLAKMGLRLSEAKQRYALMSRSAKEILRDHIHEAAASYGLANVTFPSFQLSHVYSLPLSAADLVYATSALLSLPAPSETSTSTTTSSFSSSSSTTAGAAGVTPGSGPSVPPPNGGPENVAPTGNGGSEAGSMDANGFKIPARDAASQHANFWMAYDALHLKNEKVLQRGLEHSIEVQQAIIRQGTQIIENKALNPSGPFLYGFVPDSPDLAHFVNPLSLIKLANFLVDTFREAGKAPKPLIMAALDKKADSYLVVGVSGAPRFGTVSKNMFGAAFVSAAESTGAAVRFDSWDSFIVDVGREDIAIFLERFHEDIFTT